MQIFGSKLLLCKKYIKHVHLKEVKMKQKENAILFLMYQSEGVGRSGHIGTHSIYQDEH